MSLRTCGQCRLFRPGGSRTEQVQDAPKTRVERTSISISKCGLTGEPVRRTDSACTDFRESD